MPRTSWPSFVSEHPDGHIVVAEVDARDDGPSLRVRLKTGRMLLNRLICRLKPEGVYAFDLQRKGAEGSICCGFSMKGDADRLADAVQAKSAGQWPSWASQRVFILDDALRAAIVDVLMTYCGIGERRSVRSNEAANTNRRRRRAA